jgi:hypothetical protein
MTINTTSNFTAADYACSIKAALTGQKSANRRNINHMTRLMHIAEELKRSVGKEDESNLQIVGNSYNLVDNDNKSSVRKSYLASPPSKFAKRNITSQIKTNVSLSPLSPSKLQSRVSPRLGAALLAPPRERVAQHPNVTLSTSVPATPKSNNNKNQSVSSTPRVAFGRSVTQNISSDVNTSCNVSNIHESEKDKVSTVSTFSPTSLSKNSPTMLRHRYDRIRATLDASYLNSATNSSPSVGKSTSLPLSSAVNVALGDVFNNVSEQKFGVVDSSTLEDILSGYEARAMQHVEPISLKNTLDTIVTKENPKVVATTQAANLGTSKTTEVSMGTPKRFVARGVLGERLESDSDKNKSIAAPERWWHAAEKPIVKNDFTNAVSMPEKKKLTSPGIRWLNGNNQDIPIRRKLLNEQNDNFTNNTYSSSAIYTPTSGTPTQEFHQVHFEKEIDENNSSNNNDFVRDLSTVYAFEPTPIPRSIPGSIPAGSFAASQSRWLAYTSILD